MKWDIFGAESRYPVCIFVIGDTGASENSAAPIACTTITGVAFSVSQRFVDRLSPMSLEEEVQLAGKISQAAIVVPGENNAPSNEKKDGIAIPEAPAHYKIDSSDYERSMAVDDYCD